MWEQTAVIYGVDVSLFADSNGDGCGDLPGLIERLDYLAELGVTCLWVLPCFPSARRDNGYDIEDHYRIHPPFGTLADVDRLVLAARERGIRVLLDLVVDHTSDRHPWFEAARRDPASRYRDYYVWADRPPPTPPGKGTIFPGEEQSVWSRDPLAQRYYHHRFYHFEPSLNGANPHVIDEVKRVIDFWLAFGVAGFRFDAASHLIEDKGLPGTEPGDPHGVLRDIFSHLRARRPDGALLAEADVRPEALAAFVDRGEQFNLMLNFLLNNYLWLALATERAEPIARCFDMQPSWHGRGYWANFLRNLDETDLERLNKADQAVVLRVFAPEESMRIYGRGIRRRLAPMLGGDPRRLKLAWSLLFSLPGVPLLVYGDEIGMGEDLTRPGRSAVRTPMQWDASANAGFSRAPAAELVAGVIDRGPFAYTRVNAAAQRGDPDSLLRFVQRLCQWRKEYPQIARGECRRLDPHHPAIWAQATSDGALLTAHNLSARAAEIDVALPDAPALARELSTNEIYTFERGRLRHRLEPYGYLWLRPQSK